MGQNLTTDTVERHIEASPELLYDIVSDVTRTPELSPEVVKCTWVKGATGPAVGARFKAINSAGRGPNWSNWPVVITADRGREFAFNPPSPSPARSSGATGSSLRTPERGASSPTPSPSRSRSLAGS